MAINKARQEATSRQLWEERSTGEEKSPESKLLKIKKTIRIAVSGDVFVTELERALIDTPEFQRLRGVRQLGYTQHVYPTALHTRFDHSLGTLGMADRMMQAIKNNRASDDDERHITPTQEIIARLYALLHDVTHVPFGHTIEDELGLFPRHDHNPHRILRFLGPGSDIARLIVDSVGQEGYDRFMAVYLWTDDDEERNGRNTRDWKDLTKWMEPDPRHDDLFIHDLVSNTVCADLLDYVARDSFFCNLGIGLEYRFIAFLYLSRPEGSPFRRVFVRLSKGDDEPREDTMTDLVRLLDARYMLAERAYFHHTKIISGCMLGRAIQEQKLAGRLTEDHLYEHTDETLLNELRGKRNAAPTVASHLASALQERRLHKRIKLYRDTSFAAIRSGNRGPTAKDHAKEALEPPDSRRLIEDDLADKIGARPGDVLIYAPGGKMNPKAAKMNVRWQGHAKKFEEIDDPIVAPKLDHIIKSHERLWGIHLLATKEIKDDTTRRDLLIEAFECQFLCPISEQERRQCELLEKLAKHQIESRPEITGVPYEKIKGVITAVVQGLMTTAKDDRRRFSERLKQGIDQQLAALTTQTAV